MLYSSIRIWITYKDPGEDCIYSSLRGEALCDAVQDMRLCSALESAIGRERVVALVDETAGLDLRFDHYPRNSEFLPTLRGKLLWELADSL